MQWRTFGSPDFATGPVPLAARIGRPQGQVILHDHDFTEILIPRQGHALHQTLGDQQHLGRGDVQVIPPGMPHALTEIRDLAHSLIIVDWRRFPIALDDLAALPGFRRLFHLDPQQGKQTWRFVNCGHLPDEALQDCDRICDALIKELVDQGPGWQSAALAQALVLFSFLARELQAGPATGGSDPIVASAMASLRSDPASDWRLEDLAAGADCSVSLLTRRFREHCACSPMQWLLELRLREARRQLAQGNDSITSIALDCGFGDSTYFARCFRRAMGCSPRDWRKRAKALPES